MTPEELERRAYADGDVERAALLAAVVDGGAEARARLTMFEKENTRLDNLLTNALNLLQDLRDELADEPDGTPRPNTAARLFALYGERIDAALDLVPLNP